jgi:hypothetical protein
MARGSLCLENEQGAAMKPLSLALPALLALAACDSGTQSAETDAEEARSEGNVVGGGAVSSPNAPPEESAGIPAMLRGRWGLVAADCEPGRPDAKGLLTITADKLEFYESVGELDDIREVADDRIHASFDFTGEGMEWERTMALELQETGEALVRREFGADAAPGSFRYVKCEQGTGA